MRAVALVSTSGAGSPCSRVGPGRGGTLFLERNGP